MEPSELHEALFPFQRALTAWAIRKGRAALFAGTGMGKTLMQLEWARQIGKQSLIVAPLAVAQQTVAEGEKFGIPATYLRRPDGIKPGVITVTNYELLDHFDADAFDAVVLDESSILKNYAGKVRSALIEKFQETPYRLACTATPAPNDIAEMANHAEFLGVSTRVEMLARFFVHDDEGWRMKGYAEEAFYEWLASWGMSLRMPSDLGYEDGAFVLPPLSVEPIFVTSDYVPPGQLMFTGLKGIQDRIAVRRATLGQRIEAAAALADDGGQWIFWCGLNEEGRQLAVKLGDDAVLIEGADKPEAKAAGLLGFAAGEHRVLITKPTIAGFGMNFQNCSSVAFVGLNDSWEQYYQAVRRCWRFGQKEPVTVHVIMSDTEDQVWANVQSKETQANRMVDGLVRHVQEFERMELEEVVPKSLEVQRDEAEGEGWQLILGDSAHELRGLEESSIDLTLFSPPFLSLYTYSDTPRDLGNSTTHGQFWDHYGFISRELLRVTKPGRHACVHVANLVTALVTHGVIGTTDFRGQMIAHMVDQGFVYHGEVCIDKDPQAQAIRTHSKGLLFVQLKKDSSWLRPALADYILIFRKPGENAVPIHPDIDNEQWIEWARPIWYGIRESATLNVRMARSEKDDKHIAALQLETIERCIRLWSNKGETVLSPFAGIGSEGYVAIEQGRQFVGIELKPEYWKVGCKNLRDAVAKRNEGTLFGDL